MNFNSIINLKEKHPFVIFFFIIRKQLITQNDTSCDGNESTGRFIIFVKLKLTFKRRFISKAFANRFFIFIVFMST
jgi:hypothetical protein